MPRINYVCHRECYYLCTLFKVGDILPEGLEPNKHFSIDGEGNGDESGYVVRAGDDPRSTAQILQDIMDSFPDVEIPPGASRKVVFALWLEEKKKSEFVPTKKSAPEESKPKVPTDTIRFADMTPDQIADITQKGIAAKVEAMYKKEFKFAGSSKIDLIKRAVEVEAQFEAKQVGANAV